MIRILVPLLCYSVPIVKVGYATEQAETKQLFWAEKGSVFLRGTKEEMPCFQDKKDNKKTNKYLKCRRIGNHLCTGCIEEDSYLQEQLVSAGDTENTSIPPFSVYSGPGLSDSRFCKESQKSFSTSFSFSLGIPRGSQARQDM